jgi:hypothetical protein
MMVTALGYVVAELYDAEVIDDNDLKILKPCLSNIDFTISQMEPISMDLSPLRCSVPNDYSTNLEEWVNDQPDILSTPPTTTDNWIILGFVTKSEVPTWDYQKEYSIGSICPPYSEEKDFRGNPGNIIPGTMLALWWTADLYPNLPYLKMVLGRSLLIQSMPQRNEIGRSPWIAINPIIPWNLGWTNSNEKPFEWNDNTGKTVVKSEWWRNGRRHRHAPVDGIRAEGWIVRVSPEGFEIMKNRILPAKWICGSKKEFDQKKKIIKSWISVYDFPQTVKHQFSI